MTEQHLEYVRCNLCGADDAMPLYEMPDIHFYPDEVFRVVQCRKCGLGYLNPRPSLEAMDRYYPAAFYDYFDEGQARRYAREAAYVEQYSKRQNGRLLDVGCARGDFPRLMKSRGWDAEGLEPHADTDHAEGLIVHRTTLPDMVAADASYDVITAWAVMEHVHDPQAYFAKVARLLKPGGIFIFLVTNVDSLSSRALYREDVPRHTYFYSRDTVREYLRRNGMTILDSRADGSIYEMKPVGWLVYKVARWRGLPPPSYAALSFGRAEWLRREGVTPSLKNNLKFLLRYPLVVVDRLMAPLYARWQIMRGTYGIITFVARKDG